MSSIRSAVKIVLPIEKPSIDLCQRLDDWLKKKYIHRVDQFNSDIAGSELMVREMQRPHPSKDSL